MRSDLSKYCADDALFLSYVVLYTLIVTETSFCTRFAPFLFRFRSPIVPSCSNKIKQLLQQCAPLRLDHAYCLSLP